MMPLDSGYWGGGGAGIWKKWSVARGEAEGDRPFFKNGLI